VITGRIVDEYGEAMSDVQIAPQQYHRCKPEDVDIPTGRQTMTDDIGEFRLFGLRRPVLPLRRGAPPAG